MRCDMRGCLDVCPFVRRVCIYPPISSVLARRYMLGSSVLARFVHVARLTGGFQTLRRLLRFTDFHVLEKIMTGLISHCTGLLGVSEQALRSARRGGQARMN